MVGYKAFKKGLIATKGNGKFQYQEGWNIFPEAHCARCGAHCAEDPLDMFSYYSNVENCEFRLVKIAGDIHEDGRDSKVSCTEIYIGKQLSVAEVAAHALYFMKNHPQRSRESFCLEGYFRIVRGEKPILSGKIGEWLCFAIGTTDLISQIAMIHIDGEMYEPNTKYVFLETEGVVKYERI